MDYKFIMDYKFYSFIIHKKTWDSSGLPKVIKIFFYNPTEHVTSFFHLIIKF